MIETLQLVPEVQEDDEFTGQRRLIAVSAVVRSHTGLVRKNNEDDYLMLDEQGVFVVADGMGGHAGGEIASGLATEAIGDAFRNHSFPGMRTLTGSRRANELLRAFELANEEIRRVARANAELADMGTTCVAARFSSGKERVYVVNAGDSRAYRVRGGEIVQLTRDHTLAVEVGAKGRIGAQLTRALGIEDTVYPDVIVEDARPGDVYVLCSDGLTKMLADSDIRDCVLGNDPGVAARMLVDVANDRGGRDNVTVVLVKVSDPLVTARGAAARAMT